MNEKAKMLKMKNSHFVTPNGLDDENHYSTAYDMAILTNYALNNERFKKIVSTKSINVSWKGSYKTISNTNELLGNYLGVYGVKTGFTFNAGRCLITACKQNDLDVIVVVLGANTKKDRTSDSVKILNYVNTNYKMMNLYSIVDSAFKKYEEYFYKQMNIEKLINNPEIKIEKIDNYVYPILKQDVSLINTKSYMFSNFSEPMSKDTKIGILQLYINDILLTEYNILLNNNLEKKDYIFFFKEILRNFFKYAYNFI